MRKDLAELTEQVHDQLQFQDYREIFCQNRKYKEKVEADKQKAELDAKHRSEEMKAAREKVLIIVTHYSSDRPN
jgi:hypothetical protein